MEKLKGIVLVGCYLSIAIAILDILTPSDKLKKQVRLIYSLVFILVIITPIVKGELKISMPTISPLTENETYLKLTEQYDQKIIEQFKKNITQTLSNKLSANKINTSKILVNVNIDEKNSISISDIEITLSDIANESLISQIITSEVGEVEIKLIKEEILNE